EARSAAAVVHSHVITIHNVEETDRHVFLVMHFVPGITLQEKLERAGALPIRDVVRIGGQIAQGLAAAHRQGVIHRNLKPANILLDGGAENVKITDFGLTRAVEEITSVSTSLRRETPLDARGDLLNLGSILAAM